MEAKITVTLSSSQRDELLQELEDLLQLAKEHKYYEARFGFTYSKNMTPANISEFINELKWV